MPTSLNPNAQAWVDALRSGAHNQKRDLLDLIEQDAKATLRIASDLAKQPPANQKGLFNA